MSASPQANQGLDDGSPVPQDLVPSHTADDNDGALPRTLSSLEQHADENDIKDVEGAPSDDQPEDTGNDPEDDLDEEDDDGAPNQDKGAQGEAEDDDDDDDDDDEDEDEDRPRKKRRRRRGGNQFLDIEADVDEDEDEEEEEGEEGFQAVDNFIVDRAPRDGDRARAALATGGDDEPEGDFGDEDGDAAHRRLDRREMAARDREARAKAEELDARYKRSRYTAETTEGFAPKALLMPSVNDPSIWGVKCKIGRERDLILSISRKAVAMAMADNGQPMEIISAFQRDSLKGYIYVEARSEGHVRSAIQGLVGLYANGPNGIFLVDLEEMPDLLRTKQKRVDLEPGGWVRFKRGKYAGDLAQVIAPSENGDVVAVKFIPRIDLTPKDEGSQVGSDGKKRRKGASVPIAFRPPQRMFNPDEVGKAYNREVSKRGNIYSFKNDEYVDGFCEKDVRISALTVEDVHPSIDELTRFQGDKAGGADGSLDLAQIAEATRKVAKSILEPGDHVDIFEGDQKGVYGTVESIVNEVVLVAPHADLDLGSTKIEVPARSVRKRFSAGDHVKVMQGANADETGLVVKVEGDVVTFLSDLSSTEVSVFAKDVREAAEVGAGVNVIAGYELHDLVQLDPQTAGVIIKMERDQFRILDQTGTVRALRPSQISQKIVDKFAVATDKDGFDIKLGETMKESRPNGLVERRGKVLHVYRSLFVFLHTRDALEHGGVFVSYARNLESTAPRPNKPKVGMGMNPAMAGGMPQPQVQTGTSFRPDQRINRRVAVTRGTYKGNTGMIKDVTGQLARVELHSNNKVITVELAKLKEQMPDGTLVELQERRGDGPPGARGGSGYGGRNGFERAGSTFSQGPGMAPPGGGGYGAPPPGYGGPIGPPGGAGYGGATVYGGALGGGGGTGMYGGGRTPAPNFSGGRTPAPVFGGATPHAGGATPAYGARGGAFDPAGRTPAYPAAPGGAFDPSGRTPGYGGGRTPAYPGAGPGAGGPPPPGVGAGAGFVHPDRAALAAGGGSRTPYYNGPTQAPPAPSFAPSGANAFNPSSRTPYGQPGLGGDGGKTPDPRRAAAAAGGKTPYGASGGRTPAYGAKNGYAAASAPTPAANAAPTPAASGSGATGWDDDDWAASGPASAPTPAAPRGGEYAGAPTPAAGAPTPGAYLGAPTPGVFAGAPTPAAYPSGPTPGGPGAYGASAQTPAGGAYPYQTPYAGAATSAAEPLEERQTSVAAVPPPSEWVIEGVRIICKSSAYQGDRLVGQYGIVTETSATTCSFTLDSNGEKVEGYPTSDVEPMPPYDKDDPVLVIGGPHRGQRGKAGFPDGDEWMVAMPGGGSAVVNVKQLVQLVSQ
ncbi:hypothetical protein JCM8208_002502 [Rhodotorula glutinis]